MAKFKGPLSGRRGGGRRTRRRRPGVGRFGRRFRGKSVWEMGVDQARSYFFDRVDWDEVLEPAELRALHFVGMILRKEAKGLLRTRKNPSKPKRPPTHWDPPGGGLKGGRYGIWNGVDASNMTVYVGASKYPGKRKGQKLISQPTVPAILEFGGKMWMAQFQGYDPPRVRNREGLRARRLVTLQPRPYMSKALERKEKKVYSIFEDMIGKSPQAMGVVNSKNAKYGGRGA